MKTYSKYLIILILLSFTWSISTVIACTPDWGVEGGDILKWEGNYSNNNTIYSLDWSWTVQCSIDGFPRDGWGKYINGTAYQNGTITESVDISSLNLHNIGPSEGSFIGDVLDYESIRPKLISSSSDLRSLKTGIESFIDEYPYYILSELVSNEIFAITGNGVDGNYIWSYSALLNYSYANVLMEINEYYHHNDTSSGYVEEKIYEWRLAMFAHCLCGISPHDLTIPGYSLLLLFGTLAIGVFVIIRKFIKSHQLFT